MMATHDGYGGAHIPAEGSETSPLLKPPESDYSIVNSCSEPNTKMGLRERLKEVSIPVYILVCVFAWSSWIDVNGLFVEIPLLVKDLPEGWNLPSYLVVIIQLANIGPLIYTVANRLAPHKVKEWPVVYIIISIGAIACLFLTFFWRHTSVIAGHSHSTGLLSLTSLLALVDCTSSVVYLPYMSKFKPQYMTALYIGEGMGGLIPGLVGLIQGVGSEPHCVNHTVVIMNKTTGENYTEYQVYPEYDPPRFSVEAFLYFLLILICLSGAAFTILHFASFSKKELIAKKEAIFTPGEVISTSGQSTTEHGYPVTSQETPEVTFRRNRDDDGRDPFTPGLSRMELLTILALTALSNALGNSIIPATQSYACLPYGSLTYSLAIRLSSIANPLACFVALFKSTKSMTVVWVLTLLGCVLAVFQLYLAAMSPSPPLQGTALGSLLVIIAAVALVAVFSYSKVCMATIAMNGAGRRGLLWVGGATQLGSLTGALTTFIAVNVFHAFTSMPPCPT